MTTPSISNAQQCADASLMSARDLTAQFLQFARERPDALAVRDGVRTLSYGELAERAAQFARRLRALDAEGTRSAAIVIERSCNLVVAVVAAAAAGVRCEALSTSMWKRDLERATADKLVLTEARLAAGFAAGATLVIDGDALGAGAREAPASGAADALGGLPYVVEALRVLDFPCARVAQVAESSSPGCALEIWAALAHGGSVCILPDAHVSSAGLVRALRAEVRAGGPVALILPVSSMNELLAQDGTCLEGVSALLLLGAGLHREHARALAAYTERSPVLLGLGASRGALGFVGRVEAASLSAVGPAIAGASITVVNERGLEAEDGSAGALWVRAEDAEPAPTGAQGRARRDGRWEVLLCGAVASEDGADTQQGWTPTQLRVAELWLEWLDVDGVELSTSFFSLGGDSLLAMRLMARVNSEFGLAIPWVQFLRQPTVAELAAAIDAAAPDVADTLQPSVRRQAARLLAEVDRLNGAQVETFLKEIG